MFMPGCFIGFKCPQTGRYLVDVVFRIVNPTGREMLMNVESLAGYADRVPKWLALPELLLF
jgi:hypothetical protein